MSETVAIGLITALPTATVAVVALVFNFLQERWRRAHEDEQLVRRFGHEREMRRLEWRRQDRLERLAPVGHFVDAAAREATDLVLQDDLGALPARCVRRIETLISEQGHSMFRSADPRLRASVVKLLDAMSRLMRWKPGEDIDALRKQVEGSVTEVWDRLEELQSDL